MDLQCPAVQQGMVNGDPDVDAIYRLINKPKHQNIDLTFDSNAPPVVLASNIYTPYNSQNTLYHYTAFWSLLLPMTTTFRVCDIWRSYWSQALMKLVDLKVGYFPPNAKQIRNPHSLINDARQEVDMYLRSGELITFLHSWECKKIDFYSCIQELTYSMAKKGFWQMDERDLLDAWISDLKHIGYHPPDMIDRQLKVKTEHSQGTLFFSPTVNSGPNQSKERYRSFDMRQRFVFEMCAKDANLIQTDSLISDTFRQLYLIIIFKGDMSRIPLLESWYRPHFQHILYCTISNINITVAKVWTINIVNISSTHQYFSESMLFSCLHIAGELFPKMVGYLLIHDNVLMNMNQIISYSQSDVWITDIHQKGESVSKNKQKKPTFKINEANLSSCISEFNDLQIQNFDFDNVIVYIPSQYQKLFFQLLKHIRLNNQQRSLHFKRIEFYSLFCLSKHSLFKLLRSHRLSNERSHNSNVYSYDYMILDYGNQHFKNEFIKNKLCPKFVLLV